ncbi:MAG: flotillin family protein [Clostridiales bacterium]|jgi:flotillin|nr:flotillin family protein [Clostridiales bacterium]
MTFVYIGIGVLGFLILFALISYVKAPPDTAFIISGPIKQRILIGKSGFRIPFIERLDKIPLNIMTVDIKTSSPVPTSEFININIDGVANIKISSNHDQLRKAAQIFLQEKIAGINKIAREVLEGNMREIIGQMKLTELVHNRDAFADKVKTSADTDMQKMGLEVINITIQNFTDNDSVIVNLGIDNISQIQKSAAIAKAEADKEVKIALAIAAEAANKIQIESKNKMAEQDNSLRLKQAALKIESDTAQATADAAYSIQKEVAQVQVNERQMEAEIAKRDKQITLGIKEAEVKERELDAKVRKEADAQKYAVEQQAKAKQFQLEREAEVEKFKNEKILEIERVKAETEKFKAEQGALAKKAAADAIRYSMEAEAAGVLAKGEAEAKAIEMKADAMKKMDDAAVLNLILESRVLPDLVEATSRPIAEGLRHVGSITMYGEGNNAKLTEDITKSQVQLSAALKDSLGIDLKSIAGGLAGFIAGKSAAEKKQATPPAGK